MSSSADYHVDRFYVSRHNTERDEGFGRLDSESCGTYDPIVYVWLGHQPFTLKNPDRHRVGSPVPSAVGIR